MVSNDKIKSKISDHLRKITKIIFENSDLSVEKIVDLSAFQESMF